MRTQKQVGGIHVWEMEGRRGARGGEIAQGEGKARTDICSVRKNGGHQVGTIQTKTINQLICSLDRSLLSSHKQQCGVG